MFCKKNLHVHKISYSSRRNSCVFILYVLWQLNKMIFCSGQAINQRIKITQKNKNVILCSNLIKFISESFLKSSYPNLERFPPLDHCFLTNFYRTVKNDISRKKGHSNPVVFQKSKQFNSQVSEVHELLFELLCFHSA